MRVSEEATEEVRQPLKRSHVTQDDLSKLIATPDRAFADPMVLEVVPDVFVGIQIGCVRRQEEESEVSLCRSHELEHRLGAVRWMAIDNQKDWARRVVNESTEELDELFRVHSPVHRQPVALHRQRRTKPLSDFGRDSDLTLIALRD